METIEESSIATVRARIGKCRSDLKDLDVIVEPGDLIMRTPEEYLLIKQYRETKLAEAKAAVKSRLTSPNS